MYVMVRLSVPSDAFVAAATGVAQVHRPRTLLRRAKFLQPSLKASLTMPSALCGFLTVGGGARELVAVGRRDGGDVGDMGITAHLLDEREVGLRPDPQGHGLVDKRRVGIGEHKHTATRIPNVSPVSPSR